jgi:uncharacterized protein YjiS (DUF1127 family)
VTQVLIQGALDRALQAASDRIASLRRTISDYRLYRKTLEELDNLTDRDLNDLGLGRCDIPRIARETVYGS